MDVQVNKGICATPSVAIMRNISTLAAALVLLATQVNVPFRTNVADAASAPATATTVYEVSLQTNTPDAVVVSGPKMPDYNTEVLVPLHAAQAQEVAAAQAAAAAAQAAKARAKAQSVTKIAVAAPFVTGSHTDWMAAAGIAPSDYAYVDYIVDHESGWGTTKANYSGSGAYGLGQALPASKMATYGSDYLTNPVTQLKWANVYAVGHYGSWANAYAHWLNRHSW
ncbi:hypothetical protein HJC99_05075 [Candidatus Saccharibacteria bacterium]|nr:hypothetical protein [Candidatus Saccharibacteria bacterium]